MNNENDESRAVTIVRCEESMDISIAETFYSTLQSAVASDQPIVIDGSQVERIDAAMLQMFCALFTDPVANKHGIVWRNPSDNLIESAELMGLDAYLDLNEYQETDSSQLH
jgi:anti-anti-sigma regulatory factor